MLEGIGRKETKSNAYFLHRTCLNKYARFAVVYTCKLSVAILCIDNYLTVLFVSTNKHSTLDVRQQ